MTLDAKTLEQIAATTLSHYQQSAEGFREGTRDHDVSQNIDALLRHIQGSAPFTVLDFGCGPGRDGDHVSRTSRHGRHSAATAAGGRADC